MLDIDSPGGEVAGCIESAMTLESIRANASKPIVAVSNYLCASAAYWIACSAAHEIVASPSSITGSIGVVAAHEDASGFYEQVGVKVEFITAGEFKAEGNDAEPLSNEGRAHIQSQVDYFYGLFTQAVANSRGASQADVENGYGRGRVLTAKAALQSNLVDRIEPIGATILRLASPQARASIRRKAMSAESDTDIPTGGVVSPEAIAASMASIGDHIVPITISESDRESEPEAADTNTIASNVLELLDAALEERNV